MCLHGNMVHSGCLHRKSKILLKPGVIKCYNKKFTFNLLTIEIYDAVFYLVLIMVYVLYVNIQSVLCCHVSTGYFSSSAYISTAMVTSRSHSESSHGTCSHNMLATNMLGSLDAY